MQHFSLEIVVINYNKVMKYMGMLYERYKR